MTRSTTPEQVLARTEYPEWQTASGRVLDEAKETILSLSNGKTPMTVLGGLMLNGRFNQPSSEVGRSVSHIAANVGMDPVGVNHRGDRIRDVLDDLIELGWVETEEPLPNTVEAALANEPDQSQNPIIHYKLIPMIGRTAPR